MKRFIRKLFERAGLDSDVWPVVLLLFAVVVPAVSVLWFMGEAMQNEGLAVRQKLAEAYRVQLSTFQARLEHYWEERAVELEELARSTSAPVAFARGIQSGRVDSLLIYDEQGHILYPNSPSYVEMGFRESDSDWEEAEQTEFSEKNWLRAAGLYQSIARRALNLNFAARALQAEARCLKNAGQLETAIKVVTEELGDQRYRWAVDPLGRLIAANAELMALGLITNHASSSFQSTANRLGQRLRDYGNPMLAASQRRFLMKELRKLSPQQFDFPTLAAEELAAQFHDLRPTPDAEVDFHRAPVTGIWQFSTLDHRVVALMQCDKVKASVEALAANASATQHGAPGNHDNPPTSAVISLLPPGVESDAFISMPAGQLLPGWRLALSLKDQDFFDTATEHRAGLYLWTGMLVVAVMGVLTLLAIRILRRQVTIARLKNDLAATVSHELKTPLAAMRVLVDTLLDAEVLNPAKVKEYLELIAKENERLSRVIQNFLAFSRMERRKYAVRISALPVSEVVDSAVAAVRERFDAPGCRLEVDLQPDLPGVLADPDALVTALINLLDNAYKYSEDLKQVVLRVRSENGTILFSVKDNGIGIPPGELKKIFQHFYQVDQRLSRRGDGCGLGLSIVQFIISAHHGRITVESRPGQGSTFTITLPAEPAAAGMKKEAVA